MSKGPVCPTSAAAAANEFLRLGWQEPGVPEITPMKLQKLLFYANAWHLAIKGTPLFEEDFEAWEWGPVQRDIYFSTRDHGRLPIVKPVQRLTLHGSNPLDARFETPSVTDPETRAFIKQVWDSHKDLTAVQLSNSTHAAGEPWTIIKDRFGSLEHKPTIPNDLIAQVFRNKLAHGQKKKAAQQGTA